jgi:transposase
MIFWEDWFMAKGYRPVRRDQPFLLPPDMRDWLERDHPVWLVITAVKDHLDTSAAHALRRTGGRGTAGFDPDMLITLLVWAYANDVTSSRRIERLCRTDVAFRVICAQDVPDHVTIARFRAAFPDLAEQLFTQVLMLCARLGMGQLGVVALDGTKIAASASKDANRTEEGLRKLAADAVAAHGEADAAEDALFGEGRRGDEVPQDAWHPRRREGRIAAALRDIEAERQAAQQEKDARAREYLEAAAAGTPKRGNAPAGTEVELARRSVGRARAARAAQLAELEKRYAAGQPRRGRAAGVDDHCRVRAARKRLARAEQRAAEAEHAAAAKAARRKGPGPVRNITDPDSRLMPVRGGGFIQGYNAQNVTTADQLIIATAVTQDTTDTASYEPMLRQAENAARLITACQPPAPDPAPGPATADDSLIGLFLADAGYLSEHNLTCPGPSRLIATGSRHALDKAAAGTASPAQRPSQPITDMAERLATPGGITAYRQRGHIAETPHGQIKHNMGFRKLTMRGLPEAQAEWTFTATVHNILKAITSGHLTTATLTALAT